MIISAREYVGFNHSTGETIIEVRADDTNLMLNIHLTKEEALKLSMQILEIHGKTIQDTRDFQSK